MNIYHIDRKLSMRCVISIQTSDYLFSLPASFRHPIPIFLDFRDSFTSAIVILCKDISSKEMQMISHRGKVSDHGRYYSVFVNIPGNEITEKLHFLINMRGLMVNSIYEASGKTVIDVRFHTSLLQQVSNKILELTQCSSAVTLDYFGPSQGLISILHELDQRFGISVLSYSIPYDDGIVSLDTGINEDCIAEVENKSGDKVGLLMFGRCPSTLERVSPDSDVCLSHISHPLYVGVRKLAFESGIIRFAYFLKLKEGRLHMSNVVLSEQVYDYFQVIKKTAEMNRDTELVLTRVDKINDDFLSDP